MSLLDDYDALAAAEVASYVAGGYEPDGIGLALGNAPENDPDALGWGSDLACMLDCTPEMTELTGDDPRSVGDAIFRRLTTPHGGVIANEELLIAVGEDPDYGYNLVGVLSNDLDAISTQAHQDLAATEIEKDPRVESATVEFIQTAQSTFDVRVVARLKSGELYDGIIPIRDAFENEVQ